MLKSRPARGAWVEIIWGLSLHLSMRSRPARGAWVEIYIIRYELELKYSRAPQGARGLKYIQSVTCYHCTTVAPRKGRVG